MSTNFPFFHLFLFFMIQNKEIQKVYNFVISIMQNNVHNYVNIICMYQTYYIHTYAVLLVYVLHIMHLWHMSMHILMQYLKVFLFAFYFSRNFYKLNFIARTLKFTMIIFGVTNSSIKFFVV